MSTFRTPISVIIGINAKLLGASLFGFIAWWSWPTSPQWWGFGIVSICTGLAALLLMIEALIAALKDYRRRQVLAAYEAQGGKPKTSDIATPDDLEEAGMH